MTTRKQRRRIAKEKRHEYETVWLDADGNELEEPPEDLPEPAGQPHRDKHKASSTPAKSQRPQQRGARPARVPPAPSWNRAVKRAGLLGIVVFFLFYLAGGKSGNRELSALSLAALYTALFIPFTYVIDRFAYTRYQRRLESGGKQQPVKKR